MTSTVVSTSITDATEDLPGEGDSLLVAPTGSIVDTGGDYGIDGTGTNLQITIDGLVFSTDGGNGRGVQIFGGSGSNLFVGGRVQGDIGIMVDDATDLAITVLSQGAIDGETGAGVYFQGNQAASYDLVENAGDISASLGFSEAGVSFTFGGDDDLDNTGQISGNYGVSLADNVAAETVDNSGTISAGFSTGSAAIESSGSGVGVDIINSGLLTDNAPNAINAPGAVLYFIDNVGTTSTIDNEGNITGSGYVIQSQADILDISNSGTIHGGLYSTAAVDITTNSGIWQASAGSAAVLVLTASGDSIANAHGGAIDGGIALVSGDDTITNAGSIDGAITFTGTGSTNSLTNSGEITGNITFSGGANTIDNSGTIDGQLSVAAGTDTVTNTGTIDGQVEFVGTKGANHLVNSGDITGDFTLTQSSSAGNHGQIYGNVILSAGDSLTNTGTIHGNVTLGAKDTFNLSSGLVTGIIDASKGDLFEFSGDFGKVTFDDFAAGTGTNHDTIQFAANDFASFAQVQAASTQIGADVVIKLDATDAITLNHVTLANLVSADFKFV